VPLPPDKIREIHDAAIRAGLDREALVSALDPRLVSSLQRHSTPSQQILGDLNELNRIERLADGNVPLVQWLETAVTLAGPRVEGARFELALEDLLVPSGRRKDA